VNDVTESDEFFSLGLFHVADISVCGRVEEEGVEILKGGSQEVQTGEFGIWFWWEPH
jgi:hypothetical protein